MLTRKFMFAGAGVAAVVLTAAGFAVNQRSQSMTPGERLVLSCRNQLTNQGQTATGEIVFCHRPTTTTSTTATSTTTTVPKTTTTSTTVKSTTTTTAKSTTTSTAKPTTTTTTVGSGTGSPTSPPVTWCESGFGDPFTVAPAGAVTVPAGSNSGFNFSTPNTVYWFAPGVHTLGTGEYNSIGPADGDTYVGAPGAILSGQGVNNYAFAGTYNDTADENVTIEYLTIEKFDPSNGAGAVNSNGNNGWTVKDNLITLNTPGAGLMLGGDNTVADNCLTANGEYGFQGYSYVDETFEQTFTGGATHITFTGNEVSFNNTQHTSSGVEGGGKFWMNGDVTVTGNYVHDNYAGGLWADTDNAGFLVQGNYIANNQSEGLMMEISYNALIQDNTFVDNGNVEGPTNPGFPTGAIYVSESGGDNRVPSTYPGEFTISDNVFTDNYSGVVVYQNANRYSGDGQDPGTLIPPAGQTVKQWLENAQSQCPAHLSETSPVDYNQLCQWRSQNVTVSGNTFSFNPTDATYAGHCTEANSCGQNAIFSVVSSTSAYPGYSVCNNISNNQNNVFNDNTYTGPWTFLYFNQGDVASPAQWQTGATNVEGSGDNFPPQDQASTFR